MEGCWDGLQSGFVEGFWDGFGTFGGFEGRGRDGEGEEGGFWCDGLGLMDWDCTGMICCMDRGSAVVDVEGGEGIWGFWD